MIYLFESLGDESRPHPGSRTERKEAGLVGPTKSRLVSNLAILGLKLGRTGAHLGPTGAHLGPTWARQLHTKLGPTETQHGEPCFKRSVIDSKKNRKISVKTCILRISDWAGYVSHFEAIWTSTWPEVALNGSTLGPSWAEVGAKLGRSWPQVNVAAMLDAFGRCWADLQNVQITTARNRLLAPCPRRTWAWSCTSLTDLSVVSLAGKLPRLGTFGAGGFLKNVIFHDFPFSIAMFNYQRVTFL